MKDNGFDFLLNNNLNLARETIVKRPSRIPISTTRHRSPSPPVVIYKKAQHRSLDDLRWYCLARKFSILWQKSTFGCHLRRIKSFYQKNLLRQYFILWKQTAKEDKYERRAIEFYQLNLLKECFYSWLTLTIEHRHDYQLANEHLHRKRLQMCWHLWRKQYFIRCHRQRQWIMANDKYHRTILIHVSQ